MGDGDRLTVLMQSAADGDRQAADALLHEVYAQLRADAENRLRSERHGHTLQATALVHEAYVRLIGPRRVAWQGRGQFYAAAAEAMRRILIDHARARAARPDRGSRRADPDLRALGDVADLSSASPEQIVAVDSAVARLEGHDPEAGTLVRLRFYGGLSVEQAAEAMGISPRTAARLWTYARATLYRDLTEHGHGTPHDER